jgi:hypothetical protein
LGVILTKNINLKKNEIHKQSSSHILEHAIDKHEKIIIIIVKTFNEKGPKNDLAIFSSLSNL